MQSVLDSLNGVYCCTSLQGGCIIRAGFLDDISRAYKKDAALPNLMVRSGTVAGKHQLMEIRTAEQLKPEKP